MSTVKVGIIGAGRIAYVHAHNIVRNIPFAEVKGIADPYLTDEGRKWIAELGIENVYDSHTKLLEDKEISAIIICSATPTHTQMIRESVLAGKDVFCEKPMDLDSDVIRETNKIIEKSGRKVQVGFNRRFDHNYAALQQAVATKKIGDLHICKVNSRDPAPPPAHYVKESGGLFKDMTIHDFDMVRFLTGSEVDEVFAYGAVLVDKAIGEAGDIDTAIVAMKMKSGAIAYIDNSREAVYGYDQRAEVFGSKGSMETGNDVSNTAVFSGKDGVVAEKPLWFFLERYTAAFTSEMIAFLEAIRDDKEVPVGPIDGLNSILIAEAALRSLKSGKSEKVIY
ncbi:MAG: inositol 2-dehydrogenase [Sphaerochaetaceae bacterium]|jgi:myo-inositol 2-dehydrogenase/D-chiro-inositol 1-dehydrogenase